MSLASLQLGAPLIWRSLPSLGLFSPICLSTSLPSLPPLSFPVRSYACSLGAVIVVVVVSVVVVIIFSLLLLLLLLLLFRLPLLSVYNDR